MALGHLDGTEVGLRHQVGWFNPEGSPTCLFCSREFLDLQQCQPQDRPKFSMEVFQHGVSASPWPAGLHRLQHLFGAIQIFLVEQALG